MLNRRYRVVFHKAIDKLEVGRLFYRMEQNVSNIRHPAHATFLVKRFATVKLNYQRLRVVKSQLELHYELREAGKLCYHGTLCNGAHPSSQPSIDYPVHFYTNPSTRCEKAKETLNYFPIPTFRKRIHHYLLLNINADKTSTQNVSKSKQKPVLG